MSWDAQDLTVLLDEIFSSSHLGPVMGTVGAAASVRDKKL